nr:glycosyltransferase [Sinomicrobium weinanense]
MNNLFEKRTRLKTVVLRNPLAFYQEGDFDNKVGTSEELRYTYVGRLSEEKGLHAFLHAFKQLTTKNKKVFLDVLGEGEEKEDLIVLCKALKIDEYVEFYGYLKGDEVKRILERNNILVLPSLCYENAPLSIIEGAAMGNIVMASNLGGMIELAKMTDQYYLINDWEKELVDVSEKVRNCQFVPNKVRDINLFDKENYKGNLIRLYRSI